MFKILEKRQLSNDVFYMKITAPEIARNRKAGQFIIVQIDTEYGERVPLTIADADEKEGWISIVFQAVGATTYKLSLKNPGEEIAALLGPLGNPSIVEKKRCSSCNRWWWNWSCTMLSNRSGSQRNWKQSNRYHGC